MLDVFLNVWESILQGDDQLSYESRGRRAVSLIFFLHNSAREIVLLCSLPSFLCNTGILRAGLRVHCSSFLCCCYISS